jgi:hypothetical protein
MEELPTQNMLVQRINVTVLPLDFPYPGFVIHSGKILANGKFTRRSFVFLLMKEKYLLQYRLRCHENISLQFIYLFRRINSQLCLKMSSNFLRFYLWLPPSTNLSLNRWYYFSHLPLFLWRCLSHWLQWMEGCVIVHICGRHWIF